MVEDLGYEAVSITSETGTEDDNEKLRHASPYGEKWCKWDKYQIVAVEEPQSYIPFSSSANAMKTEYYIVPEYDTSNVSRVYEPVPNHDVRNRKNYTLKERERVIDWEDILDLYRKLTRGVGDLKRSVVHDAILEWVHKYGLLGLFLHNVQYVSNYDRLGYDLTSRDPQLPLGYESGKVLQPIRQAYSKLGTSWDIHQHYMRHYYWEGTSDAGLGNDNYHVKGQPAREFMPWKDPHASESNAFVVKINDPFIPVPVRERLDQGLQQYFPNMEQHMSDSLAKTREQRLIPQPCGGGFWTKYGERVTEFYHTVLQFVTAINIIMSSKSTEKQKINASNRLNALCDVQPVIIPTASTNQTRLGFSSLLGLLSFSAMQGLSGNIEARVCELDTCQNMYIPKQKNAKFCSKNCGYIYHNRKRTT